MAGTPEIWAEAAQEISERCDLSGLKNTNHGDYEQRKTHVCSALILFGVHQTLKGLGGGSTTVSASFSWQSAWTALTSMTVDSALAANANPFPRFSCDAERLVKSGLLDIVVVFEYGRENAILPHFPLIFGLTLGYDRSLFDPVVIESILSTLHTVLIATTMPSQLEARLTEWNKTDDRYPSQKRLNHLFEDIANSKGTRITYDALNARANSLAQQLSSLSVLPEQLVVLFLDKSDMMIATILGAWKSGAAHVPVDPGYPDERVRFVLNDTQARVIIASQRYTKRLRGNIVEDKETRIYVVEDLLAAADNNEQATRTSTGCIDFLSPTPLTSKQLAYVTYTSGTTGLPKGIYKEHTSVVNSITDLAGRYGVAGAQDEVILLFSAYVFEPFVRQMLMALTTGNKLAIISDEEKFDPDILLPFFKDNSVTYLNGTASVLLEYDFSSFGETLTNARYQALRQRFRGRIFSEYGFTESAFVTALKSFDVDSQRTDMSLGRPVRNVKCYILDQNLKRVPIGVPGELYVGGLGISRGYMNRPELTRQKFLLNPFQTAQEKAMGVNGLMYKTGDLARWLSDGEVEYLGRADFQIKLRGIRIEPGEIESNIATYPGVRASVVVSKKLLSQGQETSQDHLVGYYVCDQDPVSEGDLIAFLETKLPRYMIPTRLIMLPTIPVTVNGKADLRALPAVEVEAGSNGSPEEHLDELEARLAEIWSETLRVDLSSIRSDSSFFRLGGHSITCIQLIARVRRQLKRPINLEEVFRTKTLENMAKLLRNQRRGSQSVSNGAKSQPHTNGVNGAADTGTSRGTARSHQYAANSLQQGFVYQSLKLGKTDAYIMHSIIHYEITLDVDRYRDAWRAVQRRNPALRVHFVWEDDVLQLIEPSLSLDWRIIDLTGQGGNENNQVLLHRLQQSDLDEPYQLDKGPLFRVYLVFLPDGKQTSIFSCHHAIMDGWSLPLLFDQVHEAYLSKNAEQGCIPKENTAYIRCQKYLEEHRDDHLEFWQTQIGRIEERCDMNSLLNEASRYKVPLADYDEIVEQRQQSVELPWGDSKTSSTKQELDNHGITLHTLLQLVWHLVLHSYGGGTHTITGTTSSGRHLPVEGIEDAIGLFINTLPLIVDHGYIGTLGYVQERANDMNLRSNAELGRLLKADLKHGLFDSLEIHRQTLRYIIEGAIARENGHGSCPFTSIHTLLQTVRDVFDCVSKNLDMHERAKLDQWNATECEYPNTTLHALPDKRLTYRELNSRANSLAYELLQRVPVQPNKIIALVMHKSEHKSEHMITNILAIWKTGGAYVPIDPAYPDDRIQYILEDTGALAVITDAQYVERLCRVARDDVLVLESDIASRLEPAALHPTTACSPADLAYIMYTSGTTGRPKGVMVEHHGVVNLCASLSQTFGLQDTDDEVILSFSNYVFDHFVEQMTDALLNGQTLVVLNDDMRGDKERLYRYMETNRVTYLSGTPSVISMYEFDRFASHLRRIDCVGEAFSEPVFDKIRSTFSGLIINGYGPTEVSITTNKRLYPFPERRTDKSIGQQIANSTSYVVDTQMKRVPIGAVGELYLGGDGVARGYHNRPDLTAERFPMNPFQKDIERAQGRNGRLYKTGDLVRWIGDGEIEYLGRNDFQVKIRGQRIELGEIEAVLSSYPEVDQSVVLAKNRETDGQNQLIGYFVSAGSLSTRAIRRFMLGRLPDYMVPAKLVRIDKVPVTVSGKLDSKALPVPEEADQDGIIAPRTEIEQILANIWSELLDIPQASIGIHSDFFGLGGDSLKSTRFSFAATAALGVSVTVRDLFSHPTIETMSNWVVRGSDGHSDIASLQGHALNQIPISPAQERLIFLHEFNTDGRAENGAYNVPFHRRLRDDVAIDAFQEAIHDVVARHEALRTLFKCSNSQYHQEIIDQNTAKSLLKMETLTDLSPSEMEAQMAQFDTHNFSISCELPIRLQFYQPFSAGGSKPTFLSILFHHLAFDSWSWDIFERDLQVLYSARCGSPSHNSLSVLRVQYKEYAVEHQKILTSEKRRSLGGYWLQKLADLEPLRLITDRPRPSQFDFSGADVQVNVERETVIKLRELAKREGTTLYTVVLSAFMLLVNVYTNQQDITIGIPMSHRMHPDFGSSIGFFVNLLPLRVQVAQTNFCQLVRDVRKELLDSHVHQDLPFQEITKLLEHRHDPSRHPLVQLVFNWEAAAERGGSEESLMSEYHPSNPLPSAAKFDLNVSVKETKGLLDVNFNYPTALFDADTIKGFIGTFSHILKEVAFMDAGSRLDRLTAFETTLHVNRHMGGEMLKDQPECSSLVELFQRQVELRPDDIAVVSSVGSFTYLEVNKRANQLAQLITSSYVLEMDDRIALLMGKNIDMIISILAVWKSGAAYVPLDPSYPPQRIDIILHESNPRALLTTRGSCFELEISCKVPVLVIDEAEVQERLKVLSEENSPVCRHRPSDMAYIIFTSGTTGKPKGVIVEHGSVIQFRNALLERYFSGKTGSQVVLFLSNYVFDFSLEQLSLSILSGNKLVIPPQEGITHEAFYELATKQQLSYLSGTPSVLQQICLSRLPDLQMVTSAGEELQRSQYDAMRAQFAGMINNAYGITETTVYNIVTTFNNKEPFTKALCNPLPGTEPLVLNDRLQELPADAVGELYIGGPCLARGYLNQDTLTNDRFIHHPFKRLPESSGIRHERLYKTGDLVRKRRSGFLEYLGRRDQQVKLRGLRIELSEIRESVLSLPQVKDSLVIALYDGTDSSSRVAKGLACYYTVENDKNLSSLEMHTALLSKLPSFMVPGQLHQIQGSLPVTVNGKVDVSRLAQTWKPQSIKSPTAPRNDLEKTLCQLWASLLDISHCGIDDDLFVLGGDSISSLRLVGDVYSTLGRKVTVKDIFLNRTVRALSENVLSAQSTAEFKGFNEHQPTHSATGDAPLTPIQGWFQKKDLEHPDTPLLSVNQLQNALRLLQDRHDVLRMRLKQEDRKHVQSFSLDCQQPEISVLDASSFDCTDALSEALAKVNSLLDIYKGPNRAR
ncbi:N-(5-amino-5-carboxypentanoyl)-L-cysteinyl-D-valine synthase [Emericellopsis atlantica]|uniref:N-(5-amino-5-carboxypentanoyl)-L-cysteinyl-D-valine synthase n=1 Tax=Emericellopsis atlantica TaxID=2614577 RepID=A0A9P7ZCS1_9HYPO|nr:N-(5-amino-5-carboxypentanoyl)-L-cysteinyl-D-valine synthase [Emericellopsis atlantica]KAG9249803.1 N-(5-amino-5-carboxypentanoyl)-L-cysteinyl-D-valine synthase [Emericellopsis atlantica]